MLITGCCYKMALISAYTCAYYTPATYITVVVNSAVIS